MRTRGHETRGYFELFSFVDNNRNLFKYHRKSSPKPRLPRVGVPLALASLFVTAFLVAQRVSPGLPPVSGGLPELDTPFKSTSTPHHKANNQTPGHSSKANKEDEFAHCQGSACSGTQHGNAENLLPNRNDRQQEQPTTRRGQDQGSRHQQHKREAVFTPALKQDIDSLILEATQEARLRGIATEAEGDHRQQELGDDVVGQGVQGAALVAATSVEPCSPASCGPHGSCIAGQCRCVVLYTGKRCGHALLFSQSSLPQVMRGFKPGYEGEIVLHRGSQHTEIKVYDPPRLRKGSDTFNLVADAAMLQRLRPLLPAKDAFLKGRAFASCAVVGGSGSLLLRRQGPEIDSHKVVFRFNKAPTRGFEAHVGNRTTHRFTNLASWGYSEKGEVVLVHTMVPDAVQGLILNAQQARPKRLLSLDPDFESYMLRSLSFEPSQGLYGIFTALHVCRSVTLYGFGLSATHGVPQRYYDPCQEPGSAQSAEQQWAVIRVLLGAGLVQAGETCAAECMADAAGCASCRLQAGIALPKWSVCDEGARQRRQQQRERTPPWQHVAPGRRGLATPGAANGSNGDGTPSLTDSKGSGQGAGTVNGHPQPGGSKSTGNTGGSMSGEGIVAGIRGEGGTAGAGGLEVAENAIQSRQAF